MLVCSAPQFPHGIIDPIVEVGKVKKKNFDFQILLHICNEISFPHHLINIRYHTYVCEIIIIILFLVGRKVQHSLPCGCLLGWVPYSVHGKGGVQAGAI